MTRDSIPSSADRLDEHITLYPHLADRILRQLLVELHARDIVTVDEIYERARGLVGNTDPTPVAERGNPNIAGAPRGDQREREHVNDLIRRFVADGLSAHDVDEVVNLTLKREEADNLRAIVSLASVSFRILADKIRRFCALPEGEKQLARDEAIGIRVGLIRHLISDQLEFIAVAKRHLRIRDFQEIIDRIVGPETGMGRIGGKAAGIFLASKILNAAPLPSAAVPAVPADDAAVLSSDEAPASIPIATPESYHLRSDVIEDFIAFNQLGEYQNQKYKDLRDITREYPLVRSVFRNAEFPAGIADQLRTVLERIGTHPVIVRSSSLLEDRFGTTFSGKYASIFLANQGPFERRLRALLGAIAEVYASAIGPDPILYRRENDLLDYEEDMAILIQKVVGRRFGDYFAPAFAGVAFSKNEFRWSPRIKRDDGMVRMVMGLGTRAVDRVGTESARIVALGMPTLRPESSVGEIVRRAQRTLDVINLAKNRMESIRLETILESGVSFPMLDRIVSIHRDGLLRTPAGTYIDAPPNQLCVTFDKLLSEGSFAEQMRRILRKIEAAYRVPVDVEFAHDGERLYLLQCRALSETPETPNVVVPADIPEERTIFSARKFVRSARVDNIEYIVYIDPRDYDAVPSRTKRTALARVVGLINQRLAERRFILIGPGRWGSNDIRLGVPVTYADICRTKMLIEVARERAGYVPEPSYGTHFFQDLVEANIAYLPLYPDDHRNRFNETFLAGSKTCLAELLPEHADFDAIVRVIDVPAVAGGRRLHVAMDGNADQALAYLGDPAQ